MDREQVRNALRASEPDLKALGVLSASIFGSVARGDANDESDIDVAVRLSDRFSNGGFDYFDQMESLRARLTTLLGCRVDIVEEPVRKRRLQREIDRDRTLVF